MNGQIEQTLAEILAATRHADFETLGRLAEQLDANLRDLPANPQVLNAIRQSAARNISALNAAATGVRAAHRRLAEIRQIGQLTTYDQSGKRHDRAGALAITRRL